MNDEPPRANGARIPREAREALMRAWIPTLCERYPGVAWVPRPHERARPSEKRVGARAIDLSIPASEVGAVAQVQQRATLQAHVRDRSGVRAVV